MERRLMKAIAGFPEIVREAAEKFSPHLLTQFTLQIADKFHDFYERCRVLGRRCETQRSEAGTRQSNASDNPQRSKPSRRKHS